MLYDYHVHRVVLAGLQINRFILTLINIIYQTHGFIQHISTMTHMSQTYPCDSKFVFLLHHYSRELG